MGFGSGNSFNPDGGLAGDSDAPSPASAGRFNNDDKKPSGRGKKIASGATAGAQAVSQELNDSAARAQQKAVDDNRPAPPPSRYAVPTLDSFKRGGTAKRSGKYKLHKGERAVKKSSSRKSGR